MQSTTLTHAKLRLSESNVRKANGDAGLEALAASIAEHGLLQPLIVSPSAGKKTLYDVHAGGRRWRAIGLLIERGVLPKDYAIDVRLCENEDAAAREISLAENLIREAMTPADEARAYRDIVDGGADAEAVARRFGVTVRHVQGRLRLADLAEPIFAALAAGEITLDVAQAYGSTGDRERQAAAWERLSTSWQADNPQAIRRAIAEESLSADHPSPASWAKPNMSPAVAGSSATSLPPMAKAGGSMAILPWTSRPRSWRMRRRWPNSAPSSPG
jgi:ParB family chromosome partitioning protein